MNPKTFTGACSALLPVVTLVTRLAIGAQFIQWGFAKWQEMDALVQSYTQLGIPIPSVTAYFVAGLQLVGGIALVLGAGTRIAALLLSLTMVLVLVTADRGKFLDMVKLGGTDLTGVVPFVYLLLLLWLVACGPGPVSVDYPLSKRMPPKPKKGK